MFCILFQAKQRIRELLPQGLYESVSKVRTSIAYAMSAIAHWDWPEVWPDLFNILMQALTSGNTNAVHGAMRVLSGAFALRWCFYFVFNKYISKLKFVSQLQIVVYHIFIEIT